MSLLHFAQRGASGFAFSIVNEFQDAAVRTRGAVKPAHMLGALLLISGPSLAADPPAAAEAPDKLLPVVKVTAKIRPVQSFIDKKVYNVANDVQATSGSAAEVLNSLPSVEVDADGNVSLRGDGHVLILIDGKPSAQMSGANAGDGLLQFSAHNIDKVEVLTSPPAQYRAEGTAGVINIITKKQRQAGPSGSGQASLGNHDRAMLNANAAWNMDQVSVSGGLGLRQDTRQRHIASSLQAGSQGVAQTTVAREALDEHLKRFLPSAKAGFEVRFSEDQSLSLDVSFREREGDRFFDQVNTSQWLDGTVTQLSNRHSDGHEWSMSGDHAMRFKQAFASAEETLEVSLHRTTDREHERYAYQNRFAVPASLDSVDHLFLNHALGSTTVDVDYANALTAQHSLKFGLSRELSQYAFDNAGDNVDPVSGLVLVNPFITNQFRFRQQVNAAYASDQQVLGAWEVMAGLRVEDTIARGHQVTTGAINEKHYHGYYPNLRGERSLGTGSTVSLGYKRRLSRPDPESLNPFVDAQDTHNLRAGNPELLPLDAQSIEAGYRVEDRHQRHEVTAYLRHNRNGMTDVQTLLSPDVVLNTKANLPRSAASGLELASDGQLAPTLGYKIGANLFHSQIDATALGASGLRSSSGINLKASLDVHPSQADTAQVSFSRADKRLTPQGYVDPINLVNLGLRHQLDPEVSLFATLSDVFNGQRMHRFVNTSTLQQTYLRQQAGRVLYIGLSYVPGKRSKGKAAGFEYDQ